MVPAFGTPSLIAHTVTFTWTNNVLAGGAGQPYPVITWVPSVADYVVQIDKNYHLRSTSPLSKPRLTAATSALTGHSRYRRLQGPMRLRISD